VPDEKTSWRKGLVAIEELMKESGGTPVTVLTKLAANEKDSKPEPKSFSRSSNRPRPLIITHPRSAFIGMGYSGTVLLQQFKGYKAI
jgi:hypothetical protein